MLPAASMLDRLKTVLVVIDIQDRLASAMDRKDEVCSRAALLVEVAAIVDVPIVVTRQYPKGLGELDPSISGALDSAEGAGAAVLRADKMTFDCFAEPSFSELIGSTGRSQLLLCGMETHICVTQTALTALREGFDVHVAADACCSMGEEARTLALHRLANAGAVVTTAESAAYELVGRAGTDEFKALLSAVKRSASAC